MDAKFEKNSKVLNIVSIHAEHGFSSDLEIPGRLRAFIDDFSAFVGANRVALGNNVPGGWKRKIEQ